MENYARQPTKILLTGSNRGIGLEMVRQLARRGDRIFATCRDPGNATELQTLQKRHPDSIKIIPMDVTQTDTIEKAFEEVKALSDGLDVIINNAGYHPQNETLDNFDPGEMAKTFQINVIGTMLVTQIFYPLLLDSQNPRIMNISSRLGSLWFQIQPRGRYSYNSSKAALNMITRRLAIDLKEKGVTVIAVHPGWVATDMGGPNADLTVEDSAAALLRIMKGLSLAATNKFFTYTGEEHPW